MLLSFIFITPSPKKAFQFLWFIPILEKAIKIKLQHFATTYSDITIYSLQRWALFFYWNQKNEDNKIFLKLLQIALGRIKAKGVHLEIIFGEEPVKLPKPVHLLF